MKNKKFWIGLVLALVVALVGCGDFFRYEEPLIDQESQVVEPSDEGETMGCILNSDCAEGEICEAGECVRKQVECNANVDCPQGLACVEHECRGCSLNSECSPDQFCDEGICKDPVPPDCVEDRDCDGDLVCDAGNCVPPPDECRINSDCPNGLTCSDGSCVSSEIDCRNDADCGEGLVCDAGNCVAPGPECRINSDCLNGFTCEGGRCVSEEPECRNDGDCQGDLLCLAGICTPPDDTCQTNNDCDDPPPGFEGGACTGSGICIYSCVEPISPCRKAELDGAICISVNDCDEDEVCVDNDTPEDESDDECQLALTCDEGTVLDPRKNTCRSTAQETGPCEPGEIACHFFTNHDNQSLGRWGLSECQGNSPFTAQWVIIHECASDELCTDQVSSEDDEFPQAACFR